jgi:hypothetical protein
MGKESFPSPSAQGFDPTAKSLLMCLVVTKLQAKTQRNTPHNFEQLKT